MGTSPGGPGILPAMSAMSDVRWEAPFVQPTPDPELERYVRTELGRVPPGVEYLSGCPWLVRSLVLLNPNQGLLAHTDFRLADLVGLVVSQDNSCRFCYAAQRFVLRIQGFSERRIRELEHDLLAAELEPRERAALEFARRLSRANPLPTSADLEPLRAAGLDGDAIRELAFGTAAMSFFNRMITLPAMPVGNIEALPDRWFIRLLSPLLAALIRSRRRPGHPDYLTPAECEGPCDYVVAALDGLPAARALRKLLDEAFASPILPRRTKALVFAVVAHGLGCAVSGREAAKLLEGDGIGEAELESILAHLASPALDPVEAALLPLARDTVWYEPAAIQRRARDLHSRISQEQFLEFVGIAALANTVCRLAIVLECE